MSDVIKDTQGDPVMGTSSLTMFTDSGATGEGHPHKELGTIPKLTQTKMNPGSTPLGTIHTALTPISQMKLGKIDAFMIKP